MNLKQILFGGLLMTVAFTACTNEEILEVNAPSNMDEAVALGEGYAIVGSKGVESRFVINENDGKFTTTWEKTDMVGGAWIGYQTKADKLYGTVTSFGKIMSNHPFSITKDLGGMKTVEFTAPTNVYEGKHILYYPYNEKMQSVADYIPVEVEQNQAMDCTEGKELDHINANSFAWTTIDAKGGPVAGKFSLKQVTNLVVLKLGAEGKAADRFLDKKIDKIIIEAYGTNADDEWAPALNNKARLAGNGEGTNAKFAGELTFPSQIGTYVLDVENISSDYIATEEEEVAEKPFYLAMLKAEDYIETVTVRAIMTNERIVSKTFEKDDYEDLFDQLMQADGTSELIEWEVIFDTEEKQGLIYTLDQLKDELSSSNTEFVLGADITVDELTLESSDALTFKGNKLIVTDKLTIDEDTEVYFEDGQLVTEDAEIEVADGAELYANVEILGSITVEGYAEVTAEEIQSVEIKKGGDMLINGGIIEELELAKKANIELNNVTLKSTLVSEAQITLGANVVNKGTMVLEASSLAGDLDNRGTLSLEESEFENTIYNGGTIKIVGDDMTIDGKIENENASNVTGHVHGAGAINIEMNEDATLTVAGQVKNATDAVINLKKGSWNYTKIDDATYNLVNRGYFNVSKYSTLVLRSGNASEGMFVIAKDKSITGKNGNVLIPNASVLPNAKVAAEVTKQAEFLNKAGYTQINTIIMNCNGLTLTKNADDEDVIANLHWLIKKNVNLGYNVESNKYVGIEGDVTVDSNSSTVTRTWTVKGDENYVDGKLTIGKKAIINPNTGNELLILNANSSINHTTEANKAGVDKFTLQRANW